MFLTTQELERLTGRIQGAAQIRWLRREGYRLTVDANGYPVVAIAEINRKMVGGIRTRREANLEALNGTQAKAS